MPRYFAIVPAAGRSARMGQHKLLMPVTGEALILHTLRAWRQSRVSEVLVVVRPDDEALAAAVRSAGATPVVPDVPPPDMKASIQAALKFIEGHFQPGEFQRSECQPSEGDVFLVAPADMPRLSPAIIDYFVEQHAAYSQRILVPTLAGSRGHPVLFPWSMAKEVHSLATEEGLDALVRRHQPLLLPCDEIIEPAGINPFTDIDTPDDLRRLS